MIQMQDTKTPSRRQQCHGDVLLAVVAGEEP
jgi:hypothetical protein